jgi:hypothetical protein
MSDAAQTRADAEAQTLLLPQSYDGWYEFAHTLNGYAIREELGLDDDWWQGHFEQFERRGRWQTDDLLELRILLFMKARQIRFLSEPEFATFQLVDSLLRAIAVVCGQSYDDPQATARYRQLANEWKTISPEERWRRLGVSVQPSDHADRAQRRRGGGE